MTLLQYKPDTSPFDRLLLSQAEIFALKNRAQRFQSINPEKEVAHRQSGENPSSFRGIGMDHEESRLYQPGDELRHMNWRLSARSTDHYIKVFREEKHPGTFILVDRRSAMRFGTRTRLKVTQCVRVATMLAFAAHAKNFSVGAVVLDSSNHQNGPKKNTSKPLWLREQNDDAGIQHLLDTTNRPCPPVTANTRQPSLPDTLKQMQSILARGSEVFLISDFIDLDINIDKNCRTVLAHLADKHNLRAIHIIDSAEQSLPRAGKLRLQSGEGHSSFAIDTSSADTSREYAIAARQHIDTRQQLFSSLNIPCIELLTDVEQIDDALRSLI